MTDRIMHCVAIDTDQQSLTLGVLLDLEAAEYLHAVVALLGQHAPVGVKLESFTSASPGENDYRLDSVKVVTPDSVVEAMRNVSGVNGGVAPASPNGLDYNHRARGEAAAHNRQEAAMNTTHSITWETIIHPAFDTVCDIDPDWQYSLTDSEREVMLLEGATLVLKAVNALVEKYEVMLDRNGVFHGNPVALDLLVANQNEVAEQIGEIDYMPLIEKYDALSESRLG